MAGHRVPPPGPHGGDGPAVAAALGIDRSALVDLSQTLNPFAPDVVSLAAGHLDALGHYPDDAAGSRLLSEAIGVDPGRLVLTNGGSEAITLVDRLIGGTVHSEPEFALHPRSGHGPIWRSDPHNPSGVLAGPAESADVWDEAFYPLATGRWSAARPGITVGSLTKLYACPGLRLGFVIAASAEEAHRVRSLRPEWSVNALALALLPELLDRTDLVGWRHALVDARNALVEVLSHHGFDPSVEDAPWALVDAPGLRDALAPLGVLVRDCASFGMPGWVRIAVPDDTGLDRLDASLAEADARTSRTAERVQIDAVVFDIGDTLVKRAAPGTAVDRLVAAPSGDCVAELAALASQVRLGAVTDTSVMTERDVRTALADCGLSDLLEELVTSVDVGAAKPDPRSLLHVLDRLGVPPHRCLFVGDDIVDEQAARAAGTHFARMEPGMSAGRVVDRFLNATTTAAATIAPPD